ncbi:ABC transporter substrate-binding protein [Bradyrhizobium sp. ARR65]|uniref:ABC transporter substrate-binding protein n=1 Tax=Bradyrhizobium sp. ARR65 TaxID=1040989 RepID=UPI0004664A66|nr:ABC transporter substrate-binding protein [Bradyrhizobium sp. ARR65]
MKTFLSAIFAAALALTASAAPAQDKPPLKIGGILDMSSLYADITGPGSLEAAKMAAEDFGGEVLGRKIEVIAADHLNKADLAANIARDMIDNQGVEMIYDVAASATALAAGEIAKERNKIIIFNGPGSIRLSNEACGPYTVHYVFDTYAQANVTGLAAVRQGLDTWFFLTADYAFGHDLEKDTTNVVTKAGGKVLGSVRHPLNTSDFSSFLLQAQASKAKVIGLANAGGDTVNAIKQAAEFGIMKGGQKLSPLLAFVTDIDSIGLDTAQGLLLAEAFYWDLNDDTRAFSKRFIARVKRPPTSAQAGVYSSVMHYLQAVKAAGTTDSAAVMKVMKATPINDFFARNGHIRADGRMVHDMYLFEVKKPSESNGRWDDYKLLATVPGDEAFQSLEQSRCPLVKK